MVGGKNHGLGPGHLGSIFSSARDQQCDAQQATPTFSFFICQMEQLREMIPECPSPSPVAGFSEELFPVMPTGLGDVLQERNHPPSPLSFPHSLGLLTCFLGTSRCSFPHVCCSPSSPHDLPRRVGPTVPLPLDFPSSLCGASERWGKILFPYSLRSKSSS